MVKGFFRICVRLPTRTVGVIAAAVVSSPSRLLLLVSALPSASNCHSSYVASASPEPIVLMNGVSSLLRTVMMLCSDSRLPTALLLMKVFVGAAICGFLGLEIVQANKLGRIGDRGPSAPSEPLAHLPG